MGVEDLTALLRCAGPSGREGPAARYWREQAQGFAQEVRVDRNGNSYAVLRPRFADSGIPRILFTAHIDEIGFVVQSISDNGVLRIGSVGTWDPQVLLAQRVVICDDVRGVVGCEPIHMQEDKVKAVTFEQLWVDIGAGSKAEAEARVSVGDMGVVANLPWRLSDNRLASRGLDNRAGCYIILEALRRLAVPQEKPDVAALITTREEIGWVGATTAAGWCDADIVIAVDGTFATDVGTTVDADARGEHVLGSGAVICRSAMGHPGVEALLLEVARGIDIPHTVEACGEETWTDLDSFTASCSQNGPAATALVSFPVRHMHSPSEVVDLQDIEATIQLLVAFVDAVGADFDLKAGL